MRLLSVFPIKVLGVENQKFELFYHSYPEIVGTTTPQSGEHAMIVKGKS